MLLKAGLVLLFVWLLGVAGIFDVGTIIHVLLLAGLMLLLLGFLKGRDAAAQTTRRDPEQR